MIFFSFIYILVLFDICRRKAFLGTYLELAELELEVNYQ